MIAAIAQISIIGNESPVKANPPPVDAIVVPEPPPGFEPEPPEVAVVTFSTTEPDAEADERPTVYEPCEPAGAVRAKLTAPAEVEVSELGTVQPSETAAGRNAVVVAPGPETVTVTDSLFPK